MTIKIRTILACIALFILIGCTPKSDFELVDGQAVALSDYQGKWLLINYWAIWCTPCRNEIPALNKLVEKHGDKVTVIGINWDEGETAQVKREAASFNIQFPVSAQDVSPLFNRSKPDILPTTYVINPAGELVDVLIGEHDYDQFLESMELTD